MPASWTAIYTRSCYEARVAADLAHLCPAVEGYLPTFKTIRRYSNRTRVELDQPLFRGYVFARIDTLDLHERVRVLSITGACYIINHVEDAEIEAVRVMLRAGGRPMGAVDLLLTGLCAGDQVRMIRGPLAGVEGIFIRRRKQAGMLVVTVQALGRSVVAEVDVSDVERIAHTTNPIGARCLVAHSGNSI